MLSWVRLRGINAHSFEPPARSVFPALKKVTLVWATTGRFPIWHLFLSCLNMQLMSKLLDTRRKINFSQTLNQLIRSTGRRKRQYLKCYLMSTQGCRLGQINVARSAGPQRRVWYGWSSDSAQSFAAFVRFFWYSAWLDSVLPHWTHSVRTIQRSVIQDGTCDFRRSSRFGSWADPFPHLHCHSRTRGSKAWFQRSCKCGRSADLRSHSSIGHGRPAATNGRLYRGCLQLDVLESTMSQSLEDWTHLVLIISTASELCHGHRSERSGISHSSGRLGQRS